jgi:Ca2+-binding EF-hand superfamily protein
MKDFLIAMVVFRNTTNEELFRTRPSASVGNLEEGQRQDEVEAGAEVEDEEQEIIRFYFDLFDFHGTGAIGLDELKLVIRCFCSSGVTQPGAALVLALEDTEGATTTGTGGVGAGGDGAPVAVVPSEDEIEAMFRTMKKEHKEFITFEEFRLFYRTLLATRSAGDT